MASDPVINMDQLCAPVSDEKPAGPYWRDDEACSTKLYPRVDSALRTARTNERRKAEIALFAEDSIERRSYEEPDWNEVIDAAQQLLVSSKDLWVAAWLTEALGRVHGFAGLRDGLQLTRKFCELFWDSVHPRPDDIDGIRNTMAQLEGLTTVPDKDRLPVLAELTTLMPITSSGLTISDYDKSAEMEGLDSESDRDAYRSLGVINAVDFEARVRDSGPEFLQNTIDDAQAASDEFDALMELLDERCKEDAPASSKVRENFGQCLDLIHELANPFLPQPKPDDTSDLTDQPVGDSEKPEKQTVWDRDQAFQVISRQAELFAKYEPNSPVASILRQAVRVGKLSWRDMMQGFLPQDDSALEQILKQTGFTRGSAQDDSDGDSDS